MPIIAIEDLPRRLEAGGTLAGLDLGTKTIGIAVADQSLAFAHPRPVLKRTKFGADAAALVKLADREGIAAFIIGLPMNMDGSEGARAQSSRAFVRNMERLSPLPFAFWDERLSTVAAERALLHMDMSRARRAEKIDSAAAQFILQGVLDRLRLLSDG